MKLKLKVQEIKVNEVMKYGMLMMYETMNKWLVAQDVKQVKAIITKVRKSSKNALNKTPKFQGKCKRLITLHFGIFQRV